MEVTGLYLSVSEVFNVVFLSKMTWNTQKYFALMGKHVTIWKYEPLLQF